MCRLAAYIGPPVALEQFLLQPSHSLIKQSWAPKEMQEAVLNADGFGFGWYLEANRPCVYLNNLPIWADVNLEHLSVSLSSPIWLANVRSATPGQMNGLINTQPFVSGKHLYMHNGYIEDFNMNIRQRFHEILDPQIMAGINGNTDSEYIFALLRSHLQNENQPFVAGIKSAITALGKIIEDGSALINIVLCDGNTVIALRHAINNACPSLYYTNNDQMFPDASIIASERLTEDTHWQPVPEHHLVVINKDQKPEIIAL